MSKPKVLFLCTGNSARSQMGEALLRHHAGEEFDVFSAGLEAKGINPYTVRVLTEMGLDISNQYSKDVTEYLGKVNFSHVVTVCGHAEEHCPTAFLSVAHRYHWPFEDPAAFQGSDEATVAKFREVRDQINTKIQSWLVEQGLGVHA